MGDFANSMDTYVFYGATAAIVALVGFTHIRSKWAKERRREADTEAANRYRLSEMNKQDHTNTSRWI